MTRSYVWRVPFTCDMTRPYVWHDSLTRVTWLVHAQTMMRMKLLAVYLGTQIVTRLLHMCAITPFKVWCNSCMCVTWLAYTCDTTRSCANDVEDEAARHVFVYTNCDTTRAYAWHYYSMCARCVLQVVVVCCSVLQCVAVCCSMYLCTHILTWLLHMCDITPF